jgi:hypothetical protein
VSTFGIRVVRWFFFQTNLGNFFRTLCRFENLDIFFGIWNILRTNRIFCDHLVHFSGIVNQKNLATLFGTQFLKIVLAQTFFGRGY